MQGRRYVYYARHHRPGQHLARRAAQARHRRRLDHSARASKATCTPIPTSTAVRCKAILLIAAEVVDDLVDARLSALLRRPGREPDHARHRRPPDLRIGDQIRAGGALLEITQPRGPCSALDVYGESLKLEIYDQQVKQRDYTSPRWGMSGFYASVVDARAGAARETPISLVCHNWRDP